MRTVSGILTKNELIATAKQVQLLSIQVSDFYPKFRLCATAFNGLRLIWDLNISQTTQEITDVLADSFQFASRENNKPERAST